MSHRWKLLFAISFIMLIFTGIWLVTMRFQPESGVDAYKKSLLAKGEKFKISQVLPPPVPPKKNGADVVRMAFTMFAPSADDYSNLPPMMNMITPGKAMVCHTQSDFHGLFDFSSWTNAMAAAEENRPATEMLWQAMDYPAIDFQLDYRQWPTLLLPHLAPLKQSAQTLSAAAMCDLHNGDAATATTNLCALLALIHGDRDERFLISQLVRIAMTQIALCGCWELLQSTNLTDPELAMLQKRWEQLEFVEAMKNSMLMERACNEAMIEKMRDSNAYFRETLGSFRASGIAGGTSSSSSDLMDVLKDNWQNLKFAGAAFMWQTSWTYSDELRVLKADQVVLETLRTIHTNGFFLPSYTNMTAQFAALGITNSDGDFLSGMNLRWLVSGFAPALQAMVRKTMAAEVTRRIVITAIALKRFQLAHGNYPEQLSELVPEYLSAIPLDPVDGKPLRYRRNPDGTFLLYSIGEDGIDNGGDPTPTASGSFNYWLRDDVRDWVWPQPATAAEVKSYYKHPPK